MTKKCEKSQQKTVKSVYIFLKYQYNNSDTEMYQVINDKIISSIIYSYLLPPFSIERQ